jgi:hypothetical protein
LTVIGSLLCKRRAKYPLAKGETIALPEPSLLTDVENSMNILSSQVRETIDATCIEGDV